MKNILSIRLLCIICGILLIAACSDSDMLDSAKPGTGGVMSLAGEIDQAAVTRVNDQGFADGDAMGVYIVNYDGINPGTLLAQGNHANNVRLAYNEAENKWNTANTLYWKDKNTHVDVYGYYPYGAPQVVEEYQFTVQKDQSKATANGVMGGYEASDFLWGKATDIAPTTSTITLSMKHCMSSLRVTLQEGTGFKAGEWANAEKSVLATNLIRKAEINLNTGKVSRNGGVENTATIPARVNDEWRAIVVPQTVAAGTTLFSITIDGKPYKFSKTEDFSYVEKKMMNFTIRVDKKSDEGGYALALVSESITPWENDLVSHDGTAKQYVIVNSTMGHLGDSIMKNFKEYTNIKNLKVTGRMNDNDYQFLKEQMPGLQALNLKEVVTNGILPDFAFERHGLQRVILPDYLRTIGKFAFSECKNLTGSLIIPDGVTEIYYSAFYGCEGLNGTLSLPNTLESIGNLAFAKCKFNCELLLPNSLKEIYDQVFMDNTNLYGNLILPENLTKIGETAFGNCTGITGSLTIPDKVKEIGLAAFIDVQFDGTLSLPNGITTINTYTFLNNHFTGELKLPETLTSIHESAFNNTNFTGRLRLPKNLAVIGERAFARCQNFTGTLEIPEEVTSIPEQAFWDCLNIQELILPENLSAIASEAFRNCHGLKTVICKSAEPPRNNNGFLGLDFTNITLEVPEASLNSYRTAPGWREFTNITAHHELSCSTQGYDVLNAKTTHTFTVRSEAEWMVQSKPDWCTLSKNSGNGTTEVQLTINQLTKGTGDRSGDIVLKLKDKYYNCKIAVKQHDFQYDEDQTITLQKATKGNNGGINIVLLGDGYTASDIKSGSYMNDINNAVNYFFGIEPYTSYRNYFNIYTTVALSTETGVGTSGTNCDNRFKTRTTSDNTLTCDYETVMKYVQNAIKASDEKMKQTLVIIIPNTSEYEGKTYAWEDGSTLSICPRSAKDYPYDTRGTVQHEAGGHGFGKLGDEMIRHSAYIDNCGCSCCDHSEMITYAQSLGWYQNVSLTAKAQNVPWSHLLKDSRYNDIVDVYEGAFMHSKGAVRSEQTSCMNKYTPYYNTISRESIVRRIKNYAGESFSFEDFVRNDNRSVVSQARGRAVNTATATSHKHSHPVIMKGSPLHSRARRR